MCRHNCALNAHQYQQIAGMAISRASVDEHNVVRLIAWKLLGDQHAAHFQPIIITCSTDDPRRVSFISHFFDQQLSADIIRLIGRKFKFLNDAIFH